MSDPNLVLYVASYADPDAANEDFQALKAAQAGGDVAVVGSVVMRRDAEGSVDVKEHGAAGGQPVGGAAIGGLGGLVVGLFAPPLLAATAIGAGIGAGIGELTKRHEEKKLGVDLEEYLAPGSSAIVAVIDDVYLDGIDRALAKSDKKISKAIDSGDYDKLKKAIEDSGVEVEDAINK